MMLRIPRRLQVAGLLVLGVLVLKLQTAQDKTKWLLDDFFYEHPHRQQCQVVTYPNPVRLVPQENAHNISLYVVLHSDDCNIFHRLWGHVGPFHDIMESAILPFLYDNNYQKVQIHVILNSCDGWLEKMIQAFPVPTSSITMHTTRTEDVGVYLTHNNVKSDNCLRIPPVWNSLGRPHDTWQALETSIATRLHSWVAAVRRSYNYDPPPNQSVCQRTRPLVLLVQRACTNHPRTILDATTGKPVFEIIPSQVEELGYNVQLVTICNDPLQQVRAFSQANVIVSSHGAQLSNVIFVPPCKNGQGGFRPALVEISMRWAWCDTNTTGIGSDNDTLLKRWKACPSPHRYYHKADYFQLALGMGIRYTEVLQEGMINYTDRNPIHVQAVVVDSNLIVEELRRLKENPLYDYRQHPSYNGWQGVEPYQIGYR